MMNKIQIPSAASCDSAILDPEAYKILREIILTYPTDYSVHDLFKGLHFEQSGFGTLFSLLGLINGIALHNKDMADWIYDQLYTTLYWRNKSGNADGPTQIPQGWGDALDMPNHITIMNSYGEFGSFSFLSCKVMSRAEAVEFVENQPKDSRARIIPVETYVRRWGAELVFDYNGGLIWRGPTTFNADGLRQFHEMMEDKDSRLWSSHT